MNQIEAVISSIEKQKELTLIEFDLLEEKLTMIALEVDRKLKVGQKVFLSINPLQVAIAKGKSGELSYSNQLNAKIEEINEGVLLCALTLTLENMNKIGAIITTKSAKKMSLKKGDSVTALLKASQISLGGVSC